MSLTTLFIFLAEKLLHELWWQVLYGGVHMFLWLMQCVAWWRCSGERSVRMKYSGGWAVCSDAALHRAGRERGDCCWRPERVWTLQHSSVKGSACYTWWRRASCTCDIKTLVIIIQTGTLADTTDQYSGGYWRLNLMMCSWSSDPGLSDGNTTSVYRRLRDFHRQKMGSCCCFSLLL